jgi:hypothetical protein
MAELRYVSEYGSPKKIPNGTIILIYSFSRLKELPALPGSLKELDCANNLLKELPELPDNLESLVCPNNILEKLPKLPESLTFLNCNDNRLTELPSLPHNLKRLNCASNPLGSLPGLPRSVTELTCVGCHLTELPKLPKKLTRLMCNNNNLTRLPVLPETLTYITTHNNPWVEPFASYIRTSRDNIELLKTLVKEHYELEAIVRDVTAHNLTLGRRAHNPLPEDVTNTIRSYLIHPEGTTRGIGRPAGQQREIIESLFTGLQSGRPVSEQRKLLRRLFQGGGRTRKARRRSRRR